MEWAVYIESTHGVCSCVKICCIVSVVHVKYCNHLLAVNMAGVACRRLWCACGWKNIGMEVHKCTVVLFIPTLFGCFLGIPPLCVFSCFFCVTYFNCLFFLAGGI